MRMIHSHSAWLPQVDAHNIVPVWVASPKIEYAARTIRKKIHDHLPTYFVEFPAVPKMEASWKGLDGAAKSNGVGAGHHYGSIDWDAVIES